MAGPAGQQPRSAKSMAADQVDAWLGIGADGRVTVYSGKVDLGTGTRTALAQLVAEELDVDFDQIDMIMGDTLLTIDQGQTAGSLTIFQRRHDLAPRRRLRPPGPAGPAATRLGAPPAN